jgi:Rad3-related DNA helicase
LSDVFYAGAAQKRNLLVLDECHQLESEVGDFRSFTIHRNSLRHLKLKMPDTKVEAIQTWIDFCADFRERLLEFVDKAQTILEKSNQRASAETYTERNLIDAIERERTLAAIIDDMRSRSDNWIVSSVQRDQDTNQIVKATLTPLEVSGYFDAILNKGAFVLLMSATILSKDYLCKTAGLDPQTVKFIRVEDSDFPVANRPIHMMNVAWLNAKTMNENMPKIANAIDNIMSIHSSDKGIIHTTSYAQLEFIRKNVGSVNSFRFIETGTKLNRTEVLEKHYDSKRPTVLISPSLHLGVDLKDDLSRFQIIVKIPYPDLTDRRISAMKERDQKWYTWNTVLRLIQACGRSVRSQDDFAITYILDSSISFLLKNSEQLIPKWFKEAIIQP